MSSTNAEFDIIFAGGGTAACVAAGRLAAADPSLKILLVEAGPHTLNEPLHVKPARFYTHAVPGSKTIKFIFSNPDTVPDKRVVIVTAGQCVGGGSSVNFSVYNRGAASEYDDWETKFKNPGWGSKDLIPLLQKSETYEIDPSAPTHGASGPLHVSWGGHMTNVGTDLLDVAAKYDKERGFTEDGNDMFTVNAYARWPKFINGKNGHRSDVAHNFIYSQSENKNLQVLAGYYVKRVIIENGRAVGLEYVPNPQIHPDTPAEVVSAYAKKLVVVSGGAYGSPAILERSGIGSASILEKFGVKQVVDLPGVGERYQDHQYMLLTCIASEESVTLDGIMVGNEDEKKWEDKWEKEGNGMMATNGLDAAIKYRPSEAEVKTIGPAFEKKWKDYYADHPDRAVMWLGVGALCMVPLPRDITAKYYGVGYFNNHPALWGSTHITSGEDPAAPHNFYPGNLEDPADMEFQVFAYKRCRELARRMACFRGEHPAQRAEWPAGSAADLANVTLPVPADAPDIQYTEEDNNAIRGFVRKYSSNAMHALGTCSMMPRENGGVVDSKLSVYGVQGLKIADLSIAPFNVGANTHSTAVLIGEKAALIIGEELGIVGV